ncbi:MAG: tetratricopeptide repeat protein [Alysiella sp.]|uniref:tetratricopeptide repeat protein n=1 Tax=Alysiella sp. TaxID=1872483 RepID=UPI0026DD57AF|nr:tetratricopeptide repeat protein [Alysiella sp.]MDO4433575.1 tetratricopeptide repeat protein [Alysiella sp.]
MNFNHFIVLPILLLTACAAPHIRLPETPHKPQTTSLPYPETDLPNQFEQLSSHVHQLEEQIHKLQTRIQQLEHKHNNTQSKPYKNHKIQNHIQSTPTEQQRLQQAQRLYRQQRYHEILALLRSTDDGGSGTETDRQSMYLLLQSHVQLNNCQSVIQIGQRYAQRYAPHTQAADALYHVGNCQWRIQQQDIARNTWRMLLRLYPNSQAAQRATSRLNQK